MDLILAPGGDIIIGNGDWEISEGLDTIKRDEEKVIIVEGYI